MCDKPVSRATCAKFLSLRRSFISANDSMCILLVLLLYNPCVRIPKPNLYIQQAQIGNRAKDKHTTKLNGDNEMTTNKTLYLVLAILCVVGFVGITGCTSTETPTTATTTPTPVAETPNTTPAVVAETPEPVVTTETDDGVLMQFNNITKTVKITYDAVPLPAEFAEFGMDVMLRANQGIFYDADVRAQMVIDGSMKPGPWALEGYTITQITIPFVSEETGELIGTGIITGPLESESRVVV
jgi:hypothetical protein